MKKQMGKPMREVDIWKFFIQACLGIQYLHFRRVLHRDIKSINLFLDRNGTVKVGDLGVARVIESDKKFAQTIVGTPYYLSPELCAEKPYNHKTDIWSLGCVLYELLTYKHPFDAKTIASLMLKIMKADYEPVPGNYDKNLRYIVKRCLQKEPKQRPSIFEILEFPALKAQADKLGISIPS